MKRIVSCLWGLAVAGAATAGIAPPYGWTSEPMTLDIESGTRQTVGVEHLAYDAARLALSRLARPSSGGELRSCQKKSRRSLGNTKMRFCP